MQYTVILSPEERLWAVFCPAFQIASSGDSRQHALEMIIEAMGAWSEHEHAMERSIPGETVERVAEMVKEVLAGRAEDGLPLAIEVVQVTLPTAAAA